MLSPNNIEIVNACWITSVQLVSPAQRLSLSGVSGMELVACNAHSQIRFFETVGQFRQARRKECNVTHVLPR